MYFLDLGLNVLNAVLLIGVFLILSNCQLKYGTLVFGVNLFIYLLYLLRSLVCLEKRTINGRAFFLRYIYSRIPMCDNLW